MGRWDHLYELKPVPLSEALVEEAARLLAQDLALWPPAVESWTSEQDAARFGPLLAAGAPRPEAGVWAAAFRLARLELMREFEQIDEFMRSEGWRAHFGPGAGLDQMIFLSRYLTEHMLSLAEATEGRIKRAQLVDLLLRAERRLKGPPSIVAPPA